jgi:hypothetical protein
MRRRKHTGGVAVLVHNAGVMGVRSTGPCLHDDAHFMTNHMVRVSAPPTAPTLRLSHCALRIVRIVQGPFSVAPRQTLTCYDSSTFASLFGGGRGGGRRARSL